MTIAPLLNGGAALTGKGGRKGANADDTSARQTSMQTAAHFMFAKIESRQSRVERKALVFFPTLNKRLSLVAFSFDSILAVGRAAYRRSGGGYFHLSLSSTEKTKRSSSKTALFEIALVLVRFEHVALKDLTHFRIFPRNRSV